MNRFKRLIGIARPGGIDDIVVRSAKTATALMLASPFVALYLKGEFDPSLGRAAVWAAGAAFVNAIINAVLIPISKWANS